MPIIDMNMFINDLADVYTIAPNRARKHMFYDDDTHVYPSLKQSPYSNVIVLFTDSKKGFFVSSNPKERERYVNKAYYPGRYITTWNEQVFSKVFLAKDIKLKLRVELHKRNNVPIVW